MDKKRLCPDDHMTLEDIDEDSDEIFDQSELHVGEDGDGAVMKSSDTDTETRRSSGHDSDYLEVNQPNDSFKSSSQDSDDVTYELDSSVPCSDIYDPVFVELVCDGDQNAAESATDPMKQPLMVPGETAPSPSIDVNSPQSPPSQNVFTGSMDVAGGKTDPVPEKLGDGEKIHWLSHASNGVHLESDSSDEVVIRKTSKKTPRRIANYSDSDSDSDAFVPASVKKRRSAKRLKLSDSDDGSSEDNARSVANTFSTGRLKRRHLMVHNSSSESDNSETGIEPGEVDTHDILSSDEEKTGRKRTKRRSENERRRKLKEVKKNWKDRKVAEDSGYQSNHFKRIRSCGDSEPSDDERTSGGEKWSSNEGDNDLKEYFDSSSSADDFVVEGPDDAIDPTTEAALKVIHGRTLALSDAFDHYMSTLVNGALDPDFLLPEYLEKMQDYESLTKPALMKIEDTIAARIELCYSSAWKPYFRETLRRRPCVSFAPANNIWMKDCEACRLQGHPYSRFCRLSGSFYDRKTLKTKPEIKRRQRRTIYNSESSSSQDDSASSTHSIQKDPMFDHHEYRVGVFCAQRSRIYHQLYHFKYNTLQECRRKIACIKSHLAAADEVDVFNQCMADKAWLSQIFEKLKQYLDSADRFATSEGKNNIF